MEWGKNRTLGLFCPSQMISQRSGEKDVQARKVPPVSQLQVPPLDILVHKFRHAKKVLKILLNLTPKSPFSQTGNFNPRQSWGLLSLGSHRNMGQTWDPGCEGGAPSLQSFLVAKYALFIGHAHSGPPSPTAPPSCHAWGEGGVCDGS